MGEAVPASPWGNSACLVSASEEGPFFPVLQMSMFREQIFLSPSVHSREDKKLFFSSGENGFPFWKYGIEVL